MIQEIQQDKTEIKIEQNEELNYTSMFKKYIEKTDTEYKQEATDIGEKILSDILNS
jgi:hypothetical protein